MVSPRPGQRGAALCSQVLLTCLSSTRSAWCSVPPSPPAHLSWSLQSSSKSTSVSTPTGSSHPTSPSEHTAAPRFSGCQPSSLVTPRISTGSSSKLSLGALRKEAPEVSLSAEELMIICSILCTADYCLETTQQVCGGCVVGM